MTSKAARGLAPILILAWSGLARADYHADQQKEILRRIDYALTYTTPAYFDGKTIADGTAADDATFEATQCKNTVEGAAGMWPQLDKEIRDSEHGRSTRQKLDALAPRCAAFGVAAEAYAKVAGARAAEKKAEQAAERERDKVRQAFWTDCNPYMDTIGAVIHAFDPTINVGGSFTEGKTFIDKYKADVDALAKVCAKYPDLRDEIVKPDAPDRFNLKYHPVTVCKMAALGGAEMVKRKRHAVLLDVAKLNATTVVRSIDEVLDGNVKSVSDWLQLLVFDRAAWEKEMAKPLAQKFAENGESTPPGMFTDVDAPAVKLRAKMEQDAATNKWEVPAYHDAALEALVRGKVPSMLKGATVQKIGLDYTTWEAFDEKTWVKSDANYDYYRVNPGKNKFKRGRVLVKLAGQPYCQDREFIIKREGGAAATVESLDGGGTYVKCP